MAVLENIRTKFGLAASIIIALGLLSFIVSPSDIVSAVQNMSSRNEVGDIDGKSFSYTDFQEEAQRMTQINELLSGSASNAQAQEQARDAAWQDLIYRYLFDKNARAAGISVGDEEIVDLTTGANPSPLIAQNPIFAGEDGTFSKEAVQNFIQAMHADQSGQYSLYWNYLQSSILNQQYFEKYASLFSQSVTSNPVILRRQIAENNTTSDVNFVMVPYGYATDSTVVISDNEIKEYYKNHKKFFTQQASRDIEYVVYEVVPSASDIAATKATVADLCGEFASTENMRSFLLRNSDRSYTEYWYKKGDLNTVNADIEDFVWNGTGEISEIANTGNNFYVARVMDSKMIPDSAYVKHILLQGDNAAHLADSLLNVVKGGANFSNVAALWSADQNSAADGEFGSLGWMTQSYMIPGFESVLTADAGKPFVLTTQYGSHVVLVTRKTAPVAKKQVAILEKDVLASKETFNDYYNQANKFATAAAGSYENFRKAADTLGVYAHPLSNMLEGNNTLGSIDNTREVTRWAFDNKAGKVSNIITVDNNYFFVVAVTGVHKEGYADIKEVAPTIRQQLYFEKMSENKKAEVASKIAGLNDLEAVAEALGSSVSSQSGVAFSSLSGQSLDPSFIGALSVSPEGKVCGPVAGQLGVYVYEVTGRDTGAFYTEDDAKRNELSRAQYMSQMIIPVMMQDADVKDHRTRFF